MKYNRSRLLRGAILAVRVFRRETDQFAARRLALALLCVSAASILTALGPVALKLLVDNFPAVEGEFFVVASLPLILAYALSQWVARSLSEFQAFAHGRAEQRVHRRLSYRLFGHIMALPMQFHLDRKTGALSQTLNQGLLGYRLILQHLVYSIIPVVGQVLTMAAVLTFFGHPAFLGILAASLAAYTIAFGLGVLRIAGPAEAVSSAHIDANAVMTDSVVNYETVKHFDAEQHVQGEYNKALTRSEQEWKQFYLFKLRNGLVISGIFAISLLVSISFAAWEVAMGRMSVGDFVLVNTYMLTIVRPLEMLGFAWKDIAQGVAFVRAMIDVLLEDPEPRVAGNGAKRSNDPASLVFRNITFGYRAGRRVLGDVGFSIGPGQTVAVVGPSGSGKSTLVRLLMRLYDPEAGEILLDGQPIDTLPTSRLRLSIAVVPQDTVLFNDTIGSNIALGRLGCTPAEIEHAAGVARIDKFIQELPDGYETIVGNRGLKLSGGEKQRVAIARAALKAPRVFVFDEATSSLDTATERDIMKNLIAVSRDTTTLIIAHRLSTVIHADEIIVLDKGEVAERGSHHELLERNGLYTAMWNAQHNLYGQERSLSRSAH